MEHTDALEHLKRNPNLGPFERLMLEIACNQLVIINRLDKIVGQNEKIMADINALNAEIAQVVTDETAGFSTVIKEITDFLATQPGGVDFSAQIASLQQVDTDVLALPGKVAAALAPTPAGTGTTAAATVKTSQL